jgi:small subunit ribosomal protein S6
MNIECSKEALEELTSAFKFNDAVIRHMILQKSGPVTEASHLIKKEESRGDDDRKPRVAEDVDDDEDMPVDAPAEAAN